MCNIQEDFSPMTIHMDLHNTVHMTETLIQRIDARLEALGKSRSGASREAGLNHNAIAAIASGHAKNPRIDTLQKLASVLDCEWQWLATGKKPDAIEGDGEIQEDRPYMQAPSAMSRDIPLLGSATGGADGALNIDGPIDHARRPETLRQARHVYAINVSGDSMAPEFRPGMTLYVSEKLDPQAGDAVVVQCLVDNGGQDVTTLAYIKIMKARVGGGTRFWQHNPEGEWEPPGKVLKVHRVYPWNELLPPY